jgi:outer membrane lipoprotein-sorting protein
MIKKTIIFFIFFLFSSISYSDENNDLIEKFLTKFKSINNIEFNFIQTSADMVEKGKCFLSYPKKLICRYEGDEGKEIIVKNDALVIVKRKFQRVYYYRVANSPFATILDKNKIINQIKNINEIKSENNILILKFSSDPESSSLDLFVTKDTLDIAGWKTTGYDSQIVDFKITNSQKNVENKEKFEIPNFDLFGNRN